VATVLDADSARWLADLRGRGAVREQAVARLHAMLLGVTRAEAARRRGSLPPDVVGDLDHLCQQAANDAAVAILAKLDTFRGASRFTTWAYKFAILEVSVRLRLRSWSKRRVDLDENAWERLAGPSPGAGSSLEEKELLGAVRELVRTKLTEHQRGVFLAVVGREVPIDVIAERTGSSRGAVYKTLHDARRRLRDAMIESGFLEAE